MSYDDEPLSFIKQANTPHDLEIKFPEELSKIEVTSASGRVSKLQNDEIVNYMPDSPTDQFKLKFDQKKTQTRNVQRDNVLAIPKPEYHGKDFF